MKVGIIAIIAALLIALGGAYVVINPNAAPAAVGASASAQTASTLFDTTRIIELLKSLLALQKQVTVPQTPGYASSSIPFVPVATTTPAKKTVKATTAKVTTPKASPFTSTEIILGLVLPKLRSALVNIVCLPTT